MNLDRRSFLKVTGGSGLALGLPILNPAVEPPAAPPSRLIPADKGIDGAALAALRQRGQRRVYRGRQRFAIGLPVGGICAGQLYLLGDGTLGGWHIDGRLTTSGYGSENYRVRPPERQLQQGFAIVATDDAGGKWQAILADLENGGHYGAIEFIGEYPVAEVRYRTSPPNASAPERPATPPLDITLRAYSPFCPSNAKDSALPCTVLRFTVANHSQRTQRCSLAGWLQNGVEPTAPGEPKVMLVNTVARAGGVTSVTMTAQPPPNERQDSPLPPDHVLFDFEGETYDGWEVKGDAFGKGPSRGTNAEQNPVTGFAGTGLVNSYPASDDATGEMLSPLFTIDLPYMTFLIGGGGHPGRTCMNLLVDGKVVRTATGKNNENLEPGAWDVSDFRGRQARIQIVDAQKGPWGHINVDQIALVLVLPDNLRRPRPDSLTMGSMALALIGTGEALPIFGDLALLPERLYSGLKGPAEYIQPSGGPPAIGVVAAPFALAPGESREIVFVISWHFPNLHTGHGQMYTNWFDDALAVARYVAANDQRLHDQTELFRKTCYDDTTLPWWLTLRLMMPTANLATGTAQWWKNGRFWAWEGVGCCHGTCTHVWNYVHAEARLWPELARSTRVMQDLGSAFEEKTGRVAFRGEVAGGSEYAADGQAGTVLKCYREHLCSPDDAFLKSNWPRIKAALDYLVSHDGAGQPQNADGILEDAQPNTYDIDFVGPNTFAGSLYLAALLAGAAMARRMGDPAVADRYEALARRGRQWTEQNLFNGRYFVQKVPPGSTAPWQYGDGCLSDQLFGQTWARLLDLPTVYDESKVRTALASIYRYNWAPAVAPYNDAFPPERYFARDREGGLFVCTWPEGGRPHEPVRYRDEVWTGGEYQAASGMIWDGLVDEGLVIIKAIDERYDGALHNPWNEVECGDHYARAMAAWGAFQAVCGFVYDGPRRLMGMSPRLTPDDFAAFFTGAEGWGRLVQTRAAQSQANRVEVRWGSVRIAEFTTTLPDTARQPNATARLGDRPLKTTVHPDAARFTATLAEPITLTQGQALEVTWTW